MRDSDKDIFANKGNQISWTRKKRKKHLTVDNFSISSLHIFPIVDRTILSIEIIFEQSDSARDPSCTNHRDERRKTRILLHFEERLRQRLILAHLKPVPFGSNICLASGHVSRACKHEGERSVLT